MIEALNEVEELVIASLPYSYELTTKDDESDIEQLYDWTGQLFPSKRIKKKITFRKKSKEANTNPKHARVSTKERTKVSDTEEGYTCFRDSSVYP